MLKKSIVVMFIGALLLLTAAVVFAQEGEAPAGTPAGGLNLNYTLYYAMSVVAAGLSIGLGACGAAVGMGAAVRGTIEGAARNPDTYGRLLTTMMIGLAMIESQAIYCLVITLILLYANPFSKLFGV
jgi:F-type H+-transporting ATPase subunit c